MYYYIVDPQKISQKEFERVQNVLYSSLSEFRISGEVVRMTGLRTIAQLVENAFAHEVKTIVAVGSDDTLHEVINAIGKREIVIGYIPLVESEIAITLGINDILQAVRTIAFRRIQELDLGLVQETGYYFFSKIDFGSHNSTFALRFRINDEYTASQSIVGGVISNSDHPTDGLLDLLLFPQVSKWQSISRRFSFLNKEKLIPNTSIIHLKKVEILEPAGLLLKIGHRTISKTPTIINVRPKTIKMIVGKDRKF